MKNQDDSSLEEYINSGVHTIIKFPDGSEAQTDFSDLFEKADHLASMYGIGNHKTLSSFVDMIDKEDPIIIIGLILASSKRIKAMYGGGKEEKKQPSASNVGFKNNSASKHTYDDSNGTIHNRVGMISFLRQWGATKEEIKEAEAKIKSGEIKIPKESFDWITPEALSDPSFDVKKVMKAMRKARENTININVSLDKMMQRQRERK